VSGTVTTIIGVRIRITPLEKLVKKCFSESTSEKLLELLFFKERSLELILCFGEPNSAFGGGDAGAPVVD
jgi:hypothetical protein